MTESALSDEADALYRPLGGIEAWAEAAVDAGRAPTGATADSRDGDGDDPSWSELLAHGVLLAAAHESGALDGVHAGDRGLALALLWGVASLAAVPDVARPHVEANHRALRLAQAAGDEDLASEAWIRRVHEVACRPQLTHPVRGEGGVHDHVLAAGDFKHHPNHGRGRAGGWVAHAPVAALRAEMARYLEAVASDRFAALPPVVRAAYAHHGLTHVAPFADGNGRVARALAAAHLLHPASVPFLVFADQAPEYEDAMVAAVAGQPAELVAFVGDRARATVELLGDLRAAGPSSPEEVAARDRWRRHADAAGTLDRQLPGAVERALHRHRGRADLGWLSPLTDAVVAGPPLVIRVAAAGVEERVDVDAHPLHDEGIVVLRAEEAGLRFDVAPGEPVPAALDGWLDRVVSTLALRVAAELE